MPMLPSGEEAIDAETSAKAVKTRGRVERACDKAARLLEYAVGYAFIAAVLLNFANVVGRYVFAHSIIGADEVDVFIMVGMTFLGAAVVTWRNAHLRMDVLVRAFPLPVRKFLKIAEIVFFLGFVGTATVESFSYARQMFILGVTSDTAHVPMWIPHGVVATGLGLMTLAVLVRGAFSLRRRGIGARMTEIDGIAIELPEIESDGENRS